MLLNAIKEVSVVPLARAYRVLPKRIDALVTCRVWSGARLLSALRTNNVKYINSTKLWLLYYSKQLPWRLQWRFRSVSSWTSKWLIAVYLNSQSSDRNKMFSSWIVLKCYNSLKKGLVLKDVRRKRLRQILR